LVIEFGRVENRYKIGRNNLNLIEICSFHLFRNFSLILAIISYGDVKYDGIFKIFKLRGEKSAVSLLKWGSL